MDTKLTLSFNEDIINLAKQYAAKHNISLSRLTELLLTKAITSNTYSIDDLPVANWVNEVAEPAGEYKRKKTTSKKLKDEFYGK